MRVCEISGKRFLVGNSVSHANNKTKRRFESNIQSKKLFSKILGWCSMKVCANGIRIVEKEGGLDAVFTSSKDLYGKGVALRARYLKAVKKINETK
jgi:large subunit ribosomal protein L28